MNKSYLSHLLQMEEMWKILGFNERVKERPWVLGYSDIYNHRSSFHRLAMENWATLHNTGSIIVDKEKSVEDLRYIWPYKPRGHQPGLIFIDEHSFYMNDPWQPLPKVISTPKEPTINTIGKLMTTTYLVNQKLDNVEWEARDTTLKTRIISSLTERGRMFSSRH